MNRSTKRAFASLAKVVVGTLTGGLPGFAASLTGEGIDRWKDVPGQLPVTNPGVLFEETAKALVAHAEVRGWSTDRARALAEMTADYWRRRKPSTSELVELNFQRDLILGRMAQGPTDLDADDLESVQTILALTLDQILAAMPSEQRVAVQRGLLVRTAKLVKQTAPRQGDRLYEDKYLAKVCGKLDTFDRYSPFEQGPGRLTSAFVPLRAAVVPKSDQSQEGVQFTSVEDMLFHNQRVLIRGEAGTGKTTLLRWLAVQCARRELPGSLHALNSRIPFYIQLRELSNLVPVPEDLPWPIAAQIVGLKPADWVSYQLEGGRALLLVDGLDEVPLAKRKEVRVWLLDLLHSFPSVRVVVTSRPAAVANEWLTDEEFRTADLSPMSAVEIERFVSGWFSSQLGGGRSRRITEDLVEWITANPQAEEVAATPALCNLLCAIWLERGHGTRTSLELLEAGLKMLLYKREVYRSISSAFPMGFEPHMILLSELAYWMVRNGRFSATPEEVQNALDNALPRAGYWEQEGASVEEILRHLMERVGILSYSLNGSIEFRYEVFQNYLAARAAVEAGDLGLLVQSAHMDHWQKVVHYAIQTAPPEVGSKLLAGLVERVSSEGSQSRSLQLLTLEALWVRSSDVNREGQVRSLLSKVAPPQSTSEARIFAAIGDVAIPFLAGRSGSSTLEIVACIQALRLIGTPGATEALEEYATDDRASVAAEFLRSR